MELAEYVNSPSKDRPIFNDDEEHSDQNKEHLENSSNEIAASNSNQEKQKPPQDFDIRKLIREECCIEVCEEQKQKIEDTILELVEICRQKELLCMHDNVDDLIESALNFKLLSINSQRLNKKEHEVKNVVEQPAERKTLAPILSTKEPEYSSSMRYENSNTTPEIESYEIIKSSVEEIVPILSENKVTLEDKKECDVPVCENSPICYDHFEISLIPTTMMIFQVMKILLKISTSLFDPEIVSVAEENVVYREEEEVNFEDISQIQNVILHEKLLSMNRFIANIKSLNDNPIPHLVLNSSVSFPISKEDEHANDSLPEYDSFCFEIEPDQERLINFVKNDIPDDSTNDPLLEEADLFLASDNSIPPGIENFGDDSEGDIRFLEALLSNDFIPFSHNESSGSDFDNPSVPQPPLEQPDADFEPDFVDEISVVMNNNDKLKCLNPRDEFYDDD
nr:hypothetical protein [Tanacetum cinerariifolium]